MSNLLSKWRNDIAYHWWEIQEKRKNGGAVPESEYALLSEVNQKPKGNGKDARDYRVVDDQYDIDRPRRWSIVQFVHGFLEGATANMREIGIVLLVLIVLIVGVFVIHLSSLYFNDKRTWDGGIGATAFARERYVQTYQANAKEDFWDYVPSLAYNIEDAGRRQRGTDTESYWDSNGCTREVEYTDNKGKKKTRTETYGCTKTKQVPHYEDWKRFTLNEWTRSATYHSGQTYTGLNTRANPVWPDVPTIRNCNPFTPKASYYEQASDPVLGCQREEGGRYEYYWITFSFTAENKQVVNKDCPVSLGILTDTMVGAPAYGDYYTWNTSLDCVDAHQGLRKLPEPTPTLAR